MFDQRALLFAQRRGVLLEDLGQPLPNLEVLGFNTDPEGVDTLRFPPARYTWAEIEAFRPLLGLLRQAVRHQDAELCGRVATASARIQHLPSPLIGWRRWWARGRSGLQVAHSTPWWACSSRDDTDKEDRIAEARRRWPICRSRGSGASETRPGLQPADRDWRHERSA
jgi:hypothetical protein